jgi:uncharacterized protein (DUF1330 family)
MATLHCFRLTLILAISLLAAAPLAADALDDYIKLQTGSFTTAQQARLDARHGTAIWHMAEVWLPAGGAAAGGDAAAPRVRWLYVESWMKDATAPYMQRISRLTAEPDGTISVRRYTLPEPGRFVGAWQEPARFAPLAPESLRLLEGCDLVLTRTGTQRFEGGTIGNRCRNDYKGARYAVSQATIAADGFTKWDRGFAADGTQTWGPRHGPYRFERLDAPARCADPVRMLVYGDIRERKAFGAYARALAASGLYPKHGGWYEAASPALEVFEGQPPPGRGVIIARFPCLEAARAFWNSPEYTEIRKLRDGIAEFEVLVLPGAQLPAYAAP